MIQPHPKEFLKPGSERLISLRFAGTIAVSAVVFIADALTPAPLAVFILQILLLWATTLWATAKQIATIAIICCAQVLLAFWWTIGDQGRPIQFLNLLLTLGSLAAITRTSLKLKSTEEAKARADADLARSEHEVKVLQGLLPICSFCRSIRNDSGQWEPLETYISNRSEALFSHSLCQPCLRKHYPDHC